MKAPILSIHELALQIAISQLGQKENPLKPNSGVMVDVYLASVGLKPPNSWCQAFMYWCFEQAAEQLHVPNPMIKTAGVLDCWNRTVVTQKIDKTHCVAHPDTILPGYQFILKTGAISGHTGIVERVEGHILYTIEGNSNNSGSSNGNEVVRHTRDMTKDVFKGIIMY
jgi:hypothetical protein